MFKVGVVSFSFYSLQFLLPSFRDTEQAFSLTTFLLFESCTFSWFLRNQTQSHVYVYPSCLKWVWSFRDDKTPKSKLLDCLSFGCLFFTSPFATYKLILIHLVYINLLVTCSSHVIHQILHPCFLNYWIIPFSWYGESPLFFFSLEKLACPMVIYKFISYRGWSCLASQWVLDLNLHIVGCISVTLT